MNNVEGAPGTAVAMAEKARRQKLYRVVWQLILLLFAIFYLWQAIDLPALGRVVTPSPHLFPILIGILLVVSAGVLTVKALANLQRQPNTGTAPDDDDYEQVRPGGKRDLAVTVAILCLYIVCIGPLGFYVSSAAMLFGLSSYFAPKKWRRNLAASLAVVAFVYVTFQLLLSIALPTGTIW